MAAAASATLREITATLAGANTAEGLVVESGASARLERASVELDADTSATGIRSSGALDVAHATIRATTAVAGAALDVDVGTLRCDQCVLGGFAVAVDNEATALLGASQVGGALVGTGATKCVSSYDDAYDPLTCP